MICGGPIRPRNSITAPLLRHAGRCCPTRGSDPTRKNRDRRGPPQIVKGAEMSDLSNQKQVVGRKEYQCAGCLAPIPKGEKHWHYTGRWQGDWQDWRMHEECWDRHNELISLGVGDGEIWPEDHTVPKRFTEAGLL